MVKALITGGTGFVGSHIVRQLLEDGHQVRVLHRSTSRLDALAGLDYESALGDILEKDALKKACEGCTWVFHVAAVADYWRANRSRMFDANVEGTRCVLEAAQEKNVSRVVFTSSSAAIGMNPGRQASDETVEFNLPPDQFPYGFSKVLAEKVVKKAVEAGQDVVIVNPCIVMGPGDLNMISGSFIAQIKRIQWLTPLTNGGIPVIDVRDVARYHIAAAERGKSGERYILNAENLTYHHWFKMIAEIVGVPAPRFALPDFLPPTMAVVIDTARRFNIPTMIDATQARMGTQYVYFDASKAHAEFGSPQIDMHQSLEDTYRWYINNGYLKADLLETTVTQLGKLLGIQ